MSVDFIIKGAVCHSADSSFFLISERIRGGLKGIRLSMVKQDIRSELDVCLKNLDGTIAVTAYYGIR